MTKNSSSILILVDQHRNCRSVYEAQLEAEDDLNRVIGGKFAQ